MENFLRGSAGEIYSARLDSKKYGYEDIFCPIFFSPSANLQGDTEDLQF